MKIKQDKGVTLVVLVITLIVLAILSGVSMNIGYGLIKKAKLENLKTNMLLIQAKAKEYVEQANFKLGTGTEITDEVKAELKGEEIQDTTTINKYSVENGLENKLCYKLNDDNLKDMGLSNIETTDTDYYIVIYDIENIKVEVINTRGYISQDKKVYYTLSELNNIEE